ncbi:MAG: hypothetical protein RIB32_02055 [Phycisphaerales bacterium]
MRGAIGLFMAAGAANAQIVASFGFTDLDGIYDDTTSIFTVTGQTIASGDFTRNGDGTALFNSGLLSGSGPASFFLEMSVDGIDAVNRTATGSGNLVITDADGDVFRGTFTGDWIGTALGFTFASNTGVDFSFDSSGGNGTFDGTTGGSFTSFADSAIFDGAVSLLFLQPNNANFFQSSFEAINTQADGIILPAPGAAGLALMGLGVAGIRRRR